MNMFVIKSSQIFFFQGSTVNSNGTENSAIGGRNSSLADVEESLRPSNILTASDLPSLRDLLSDKKITGCSIVQYG